MAYFAPDVTVIGGGLAGTEAAWQLAERGLRVALIDMKPVSMSPAHRTPLLGELVCSNSLRSDLVESGAGLLKAELRACDSMVIACADQHKVPAGSALAVERFGFGRAVTTRLALHPNVRIERRVIDELPDGPVIMATGPLTGGKLARQIRSLLGGDRLYFYDAIAPIVMADSIDPAHSWRGSRWNKHTPGAGASPSGAGAASEAEAGPPDEAGSPGDYINCPLDQATYDAFVDEIVRARKVVPHAFEEPKFFEGCLPIEVIAERGLHTLRYGPMRPVGLYHPDTGKRPYAVLQLRPENQYLTAYNLVGFQTRMAYPEQKRIFAMIPALRNAEFLRFGSIHRNTYIDSPRLLGPELELRDRPDVRFAGLITGVEGYIESCAMGLLAAWFCAARLSGETLTAPPPTTALGGLYHHITAARDPKEAFTPTNINFGLLPPLGVKHKKRERKGLMAVRAQGDLRVWLEAHSKVAA